MRDNSGRIVFGGGTVVAVEIGFVLCILLVGIVEFEIALSLRSAQ